MSAFHRGMLASFSHHGRWLPAERTKLCDSLFIPIFPGFWKSPQSCILLILLLPPVCFPISTKGLLGFPTECLLHAERRRASNLSFALSGPAFSIFCILFRSLLRLASASHILWFRLADASSSSSNRGVCMCASCHPVALGCFPQKRRRNCPPHSEGKNLKLKRQLSF